MRRKIEKNLIKKGFDSIDFFLPQSYQIQMIFKQIN